MATISALASISDVENQLRSLFNVVRYNGLTQEQREGIFSVSHMAIGTNTLTSSKK